MGGGSMLHWVIVGIVVMLFFGRGKISDMMGDVAKGIKAFKKGMADDETPAPPTPIQPGQEPVRTIDHQAGQPTAAAPVASGSTFADRKLS